MSLRTLSLALVGLVVSACAKRAPETAAPEEAGAAGPAGGEASEDIDALEAQLAAREDQLRALGAAPPAGGAGEVEMMGATATSQDKNDERTTDQVAKKSAEAQSVSAEPTPATAPMQAEARPAPPGARCESVCEVTTSICQLRDNICELARRHADEPRYGRTCDRAVADCEFATEACHACT
ncbi:hypothetical protein [Nannocystis sp. SCPEA4]|uniref:hypothetical protein n=1 Tax=Nannocystis sp. SCPEA4 TaxID=2996787 RepID=UPI00226EDD9B|nr:hypothetical protein [Nannocystis sp. SCPEA4]MCY1057210.1 hypothetical protein [Nannocystis sp. SCPEA4]